MFLAVDTHYDDAQDRAWTGFVLFADWTDPNPVEEGRTSIVGLAPYRSGEFYRRELPCLQPVIDAVLARRLPIHTVVVDGYVDLGRDAASPRPGMGRYLYQAYSGAGFQVVGVAKNRFEGAPYIEVFRGGSTRPLYLTATRDEVDMAKRVAAMAGNHRLPDLLRRVDHLARGLADGPKS